MKKNRMFFFVSFILFGIFFPQWIKAGSENALNGGGCSSNPVSTSNDFTVGGTVSGLTGTVVLQNNDGDDLTLAENGKFTFSTPLVNGASYSVTVLTQPVGQFCTTTNSTGVINGANITTVFVQCDNLYSIGGSLTGLGAHESVTLQNNGGDDLLLTANTSFVFSTSSISGSSYDVTVLTNPARQVCTVLNGSGVVSGNVTNILVNCVTNHPRTFVTDSTFNGDLKTNGAGSNGISGADNLCMSDTNYLGSFVNGIGTYKAFIVDGTNRVACTTANCSVGGASENVNWVLKANTTYYQIDDMTPIGTTTSSGIFSFPLTNSFTGSADKYWTGFASNWTSANAFGLDCNQWQTSAAGSGVPGSGNVTTNSAISNTVGLPLCNNSSQVKLFCVEQ